MLLTRGGGGLLCGKVATHTLKPPSKRVFACGVALEWTAVDLLQLPGPHCPLLRLLSSLEGERASGIALEETLPPLERALRHCSSKDARRQTVANSGLSLERRQQTADSCSKKAANSRLLLKEDVARFTLRAAHIYARAD